MKHSRTINHEQVESMLVKGMSPRQIANRMKVSRVRVKRILDRMRARQEEPQANVVVPAGIVLSHANGVRIPTQAEIEQIGKSKEE